MHPAGRGDTPTDVMAERPQGIGRGAGWAADDDLP